MSGKITCICIEYYLLVVFIEDSQNMIIIITTPHPYININSCSDKFSEKI